MVGLDLIKSVELTNSMTEKIRKEIVFGVNVSDNTLNGVSVVFANKETAFDEKMYIKFSINGENFKEEIVLGARKKPTNDQSFLYEHREFIARRLADNILKQLFTTK